MIGRNHAGIDRKEGARYIDLHLCRVVYTFSGAVSPSMLLCGYMGIMRASIGWA